MTYTIKPSEIYQGSCQRNKIVALLEKDNLKIIGFRPPKVGEYYIDADVRVQMHAYDRGWAFIRFIVQYRPQKQTSFWE